MARKNDVEVIEEGKVLSVAESKTRNGTFYRLEVEDLDTGDSEWYGLGDEKPDYGEGSIISFDYEESNCGKYLNIDAGSVDVLEEVKPKRGGRGGSKGNSRGNSRGRNDDDASSNRRSNSRSSGRSGGNKSSGSGSRNSGGKSGGKGSGGNGGTDWEAKDKRTALGFAREQGMKLTSQMLAEGAIKLPTKTAEKMDAYLEYVDMFTARFLSQADAYLEEGIEAIYDEQDD